MIDRPARDWLADLVERTVAGEFDPFAYPNKPFPDNPHEKSKDAVVEETMEELGHFCGGKHQVNGAGVMGMIVNPDDEVRRMRNLTTFLRSDFEFPESGGGWIIPAVFAVVALLITWFTRAGHNPGELAGRFVMSFFGCFIVVMAPLYMLAELQFVYFRWIRPPKLKTDAEDPWPFATLEQLLAERERQGARQ
jgi:hypothetical protein